MMAIVVNVLDKCVCGIGGLVLGEKIYSSSLLRDLIRHVWVLRERLR